LEVIEEEHYSHSDTEESTNNHPEVNHLKNLTTKMQDKILGKEELEQALAIYITKIGNVSQADKEDFYLL